MRVGPNRRRIEAEIDQFTLVTNSMINKNLNDNLISVTKDICRAI